HWKPSTPFSHRRAGEEEFGDGGKPLRKGPKMKAFLRLLSPSTPLPIKREGRQAPLTDERKGLGDENRRFQLSIGPLSEL
ncbi:MAG: hypothetical protein ACP5R4_09160, partial [Armatimonadota bacterium]